MIPKDISDIIHKYIADMILFESQPIPKENGFIRPLNLIIFGICTLNELIIHQILHTSFLYDTIEDEQEHEHLSSICDIISLPDNFLTDFERACSIFDMRLGVWNIHTNLLPTEWIGTIPYITLNFLLNSDLDQLVNGVGAWVNEHTKGESFKDLLLPNP